MKKSSTYRCCMSDSTKYLQDARLGQVIDEIVLQSKIEFNYDEE